MFHSERYLRSNLHVFFKPIQNSSGTISIFLNLVFEQRLDQRHEIVTQLGQPLKKPLCDKQTTHSALPIPVSEATLGDVSTLGFRMHFSSNLEASQSRLPS